MTGSWRGSSGKAVMIMTISKRKTTIKTPSIAMKTRARRRKSQRALLAPRPHPHMFSIGPPARSAQDAP
eukprot:2614701-Pyramimonas_sp.AAC.1